MTASTPQIISIISPWVFVWPKTFNILSTCWNFVKYCQIFEIFNNLTRDDFTCYCRTLVVKCYKQFVCFKSNICWGLSISQRLCFTKCSPRVSRCLSLYWKCFLNARVIYFPRTRKENYLDRGYNFWSKTGTKNNNKGWQQLTFNSVVSSRDLLGKPRFLLIVVKGIKDAISGLFSHLISRPLTPHLLGSTNYSRVDKSHDVRPLIGQKPGARSLIGW